MMGLSPLVKTQVAVSVHHRIPRKSESADQAHGEGPLAADNGAVARKRTLGLMGGWFTCRS